MNTEDTTKADDIIDDLNKVSALCRKHAGHIRDIRMTRICLNDYMMKEAETRTEISRVMNRLGMDQDKIHDLLTNLPKP